MPGIHIHFPQTFEVDSTNIDSDAVSITGVSESGVALTDISSISFTTDSSATYNPNCQLDEYICYLIIWEMTTDITAGSRLTVETKNLKNPESIAKAGDITVTTMMKYSADA